MTSVANALTAVALITLGVAIAAMGVYLAEVDDAPGGAAMGLLVMIAAVLLGVRAARNRLPGWAARTALAVGVLVAAFAGFLTHAVSAAAPLFEQPPAIPSVGEPAPSPESAATIDRARSMVRAAVVEQNLPGLSIAVGVGGAVVWAEGFGWRDVSTHTPVTPETRFNIGTAAPAVAGAAEFGGFANTGAEPAAAWSPEAIGEPGEDFPPLTLMRKLVLQPLGLVRSEYPLPGDRATFYVPRSEDNHPGRGRRLMYMRDLACCAGEMAFYSTPSDLVRFALATTKIPSVNGELAGGRVMSLLTRPESGLAVAIASNIAHADTSDLALKVADVFAKSR